MLRRAWLCIPVSVLGDRLTHALSLIKRYVRPPLKAKPTDGELAIVAKAARDYPCGASIPPENLAAGEIIVRRGLAAMYEVAERWPEAVKAYEAALELEPTAMDLQFRRADCWRFAGDLERAREAYEVVASSSTASQEDRFLSQFFTGNWTDAWPALDAWMSLNQPKRDAYRVLRQQGTPKTCMKAGCLRCRSNLQPCKVVRHTSSSRRVREGDSGGVRPVIAFCTRGETFGERRSRCRIRARPPRPVRPPLRLHRVDRL